MEMNPEDNAMQRAHHMVWAVGVVLALAGFGFFGVTAGVSVLTGAVIAALNLLVLSRSVRRMVDGGRAAWAVVAVLKFLVLLVVTFVLIDRQLVSPMALAVGFGALPFGILLSGTFSGAGASLS